MSQSDPFDLSCVGVTAEAERRRAGTGAREEVRFAGDSPLEGDGFEPSVPGKRSNFLWDASVSITRKSPSPPRPALSRQEPMVRIHLPPPASPRTLGPSRDEIRPRRQAAAQHSSKAEPDQADSLDATFCLGGGCGCEKSAAFVSMLDRTSNNP